MYNDCRIVVLSYPEHFFSTFLCVKSIVKQMDRSDITIMLDDFSEHCWDTYQKDFENYIKRSFPEVRIGLYSMLPGIEHCQVGWWRQQLIKLTVDVLFDDEEFLVVDGDVIFDSAIDCKGIIPISPFPTIRQDTIGRMMGNYVSKLLDIPETNLLYNGQPAITNTMPFRHLSKPLLSALRHHVENKHGRSFIDLHLEWMSTGRIELMWDGNGGTAMSEFELIELFKHYVMRDPSPMVDTGNGFHTFVDTSDQPGWKFRHSSLKDREIGKQWFVDQGVEIDDAVWEHIDKNHNLG